MHLRKIRMMLFGLAITQLVFVNCDIKVEAINSEQTVEEENVMELSEEEILLLKKVTFAEGGICSQDVQQAIAATVIERARLDGTSIERVIFKKDQFSCVDNGVICTGDGNGNSIPVTDEMAEKVTDAVEAALEEGAGEIAEELTKMSIDKCLDPKTYGGEPLYFYSPRWCSKSELKKRENIQVSYSIDGVVFYREWG